MTQENQNFFEFTDRWSDLGELPEESLPPDMITALDDRDKQLEHYLEIRSPGLSGHVAQTVGVAGVWNDNGIDAVARTTGTLALAHGGTDYPTSFYPWVCPHDGVVTDVGWYSGTGSISSRIAMYNADGIGGLPLTLHRDLEHVPTTAITPTTYSYTLPVPMVVVGGRKYWWMKQTTANATVGVLAAGSSPVSVGFLTASTLDDCVLKSVDTLAGGAPLTLGALVNISGTEPNVRFAYKLTPS